MSMEPPKLGSRVVATIPIGAGTDAAFIDCSGACPGGAIVGTASASALDTASAAPAPTPHGGRLRRRHQRRHRLRLRPSRKKSTRYSSMRISLAPWAPTPPRRRRGVPAPPHRQPRPVPQPRPLVAPRMRRCRSCPVQKARRSASARASRSRAAAAAPVAVASAEPAETVPASAPSGGALRRAGYLAAQRGRCQSELQRVAAPSSPVN